jgi:hypothetical protein
MNTLRFKAGYLPNLPGLSDQELVWHDLPFGTTARPLVVQVPLLTPAQMTALAHHVRQASRKQLKSFSVADIVALIDRAVACLLDANNPYRQQLNTFLPQVTGLDADMVRIHLTHYLLTFRALQLQRFVVEDFGNPQMLDAFQPRVSGGWSKALGADLIAHVWAGNVPGLPMWSLVSSLLVKSGSIGKVASAEPVFAGVLARVLVEVEPRLADCLAVVWWPGSDALQARPLFAQADAVLAYGGTAALSAIQKQVPVTARFLPHGHKLSFGMVSTAALTLRRAKTTATLAALDVARYEQQGCYSPHMFYVQRGAPVSPQEFAQALASELAALAHKFPRRVLSLEEARSVAAWRESHELAMLTDDTTTQVMGDATQPWAVVYTDTSTSLQPGPLNRSVLVVGVDTLDDVEGLVQGQRNYLQTAGLAATPEELLRLSECLARAGVTRICAIGSMTAPAAGWHHDGRFSLLDLVRMVDIEASTEVASEGFTTYEP